MPNFTKNILLFLFISNAFVANATNLIDLEDNLNNITKNKYYDHRQEKLQEKIVSYLTLCLKQITNNVHTDQVPLVKLEDVENRKQVIEYFKTSRGECAGLSVLWSYGHFLQDQPNPDQVERDDLTNFHTMYNRLVTWNGEENFNPKEQKQLNSFIENIRLYQMKSSDLFPERNNCQLDLEFLLQDTKRGNPLLKFKFPDTFLSKEMLSRRLKQAIQPGTMIFLGTEWQGRAHLMAAYQSINNGSIFFYDPNAFEGEVEVNGPEELMCSFWRASDPSQFISSFYGLDPMSLMGRTVSIDIFSFPTYLSNTYPLYKDFSVTGKEILDLMLDRPVLITRFNKTPEIIKLMSSLNKNALVDILTYKIGENVGLLKKMDYEERLPLLKKEITDHYINGNEKVEKELVIKQLAQFIFSINDITTDQMNIINQLTSQACNLNKVLSLTDIMVILAANPGNNKLVKELFETFLASHLEKTSREVAGKKLSQNRNSIYINAAIISNLEKGSIDISKKIIKYLSHNFGVFPTLANVKSWRSIELEHYLDLKEPGWL